MPRLKDCIYERSPIATMVEYKNNNLAYTTQYAGIKIVDIVKCEQIDKVVLKELNVNSISPSFSRDNKKFAFANNDIIYIISLETQKIEKKIQLINSSVETLIFNWDATHILVATNDGRVLQYRCDNSALIARLHSSAFNNEKKIPHIVNHFALYRNKLACSATDGSLTIIDLEVQSRKSVLIKSAQEITALKFIDEFHLISADKSGILKIHNLKQRVKLKKLNAPFCDIDNIALANNNTIAFISSQYTNYISAIDLEKGVVLKAKYIEGEDNFQSILVTNNNLLVTLSAQTKIEKVNLPTLKDIEELVEKNSFMKAYRLLENEPLLKLDSAYELVEHKYQEIYYKIIDALSEENRALALRLSKLFFGIKDKELEVQNIFASFKYFNEFKINFIQKRYALAYTLAIKYPPLQHTVIYQKLEEKYLAAFLNAKRHMDLDNVIHAKALLQEYLTIPTKRPIIKLLLQKDIYFFKFLKAVEKKDFQIQEELLLTHKIFALAPTYRGLDQSIEKNIKNIESFIQECDLVQAKELLLKFKSTPYMKANLIRLTMKMKKMNLFKEHYKAHNLKHCYELLDLNPFLQQSTLGMMLSDQWNILINKLEVIALQGDLKKLLQELDLLLFIKTRRNIIGNLLRIASLSKVKSYIVNKKSVEAKKLIFIHIDIFGKDNEVLFLMDRYEALFQEKLPLICEETIGRDNWLHENILERYEGF